MNSSPTQPAHGLDPARPGSIPTELYEEILRRMPIAAVDILFFTPDLKKTLLGLRENNPLKGEWFSFGGRIFKDDGTLVEAAQRIVFRETGLKIDLGKLVFGGALMEHHPCSMFEGVCLDALDSYYGVVVSEEIQTALDAQHSETRWFDVDDPSFHPYVVEKVAGCLVALQRQ